MWCYQIFKVLGGIILSVWALESTSILIFQLQLYWWTLNEHDKHFLVYILYINIIILPLAMKIRGSSRRNSQGIIIYQPAWLLPSKLEYFNCKFNLHIKSPEIKEWILLWMSLGVQHINIWTLDQWYIHYPPRRSKYHWHINNYYNIKARDGWKVNLLIMWMIIK